MFLQQFTSALIVMKAVIEKLLRLLLHRQGEDVLDIIFSKRLWRNGRNSGLPGNRPRLSLRKRLRFVDEIALDEKGRDHGDDPKKNRRSPVRERALRLDRRGRLHSVSRRRFDRRRKDWHGDFRQTKQQV